MKKRFLIVLALVLVAIPAVVFANGVMEGEAEAEPPTDVEAEFEFEESGGVLTITGEGEGFEFGEEYISLVYGIGSLVEGPGACEPAGTLEEDHMFVGFWVVSPDGKATLIQTPEGASLAALADISTISVRRVAIMFAEGLGGEEIGPVVVFPVDACGAVESDNND